MNISQSIGYSNTGDSIFLGASDGLVGYINKNDQNHGEVWNWTWTDATAFGIYANWESGNIYLNGSGRTQLGLLF